eukprot:1008694-Amphidinium_carterae.1
MMILDHIVVQLSYSSNILWIVKRPSNATLHATAARWAAMSSSYYRPCLDEPLNCSTTVSWTCASLCYRVAVSSLRHDIVVHIDTDLQ